MVWAGSPVPLFHPDAQGGRGRGREAHARHQDPGLPRPARAPGPLPPREDHRHRRRSRVRQRHRHDRPGRRPLRHLRAPRAPQARLARRRHAPRGPGRRRRCQALHHALARGQPARRCRRRSSRRRSTARRASTVQVVRTVAEDMYDAVPKATSASSSPTSARSARPQDYIYLENQFLWSPEIVDDPHRQAQHPPSPDFRLVVLLPARANNGQDDTRGQLAVLADADDTGNPHFLATTIRSRTGGRDDPLYVHAKVGIVDDRWLTVGSANLNAHSLLNDTEMNVVTDDAVARPRHPRAPLGRAPRGRAVDEIAGAAARPVVDERWRPIAMEQLRRRRGGRAADAPPDRPPGRLEAFAPAARPAAGDGRRRLGRRSPPRPPPA